MRRSERLAGRPGPGALPPRAGALVALGTTWLVALAALAGTARDLALAWVADPAGLGHGAVSIGKRDEKLGHSSITTTMIYAHHTHDHLRESLHRLDLFFSN